MKFEIGQIVRDYRHPCDKHFKDLYLILNIRADSEFGGELVYDILNLSTLRKIIGRFEWSIKEAT